MQWLMDLAARYRSGLRSGAFFQSLARARQPADLSWVYQLYHQSREFTQALSLRSALCRDPQCQDVFAEHAEEETDHPAQLAGWMREHGYLVGSQAGDVPPTPETLDCAGFIWRIALREPHDVQVIALNLLSEGVALDFYTAVIPVLERLGIQSGRYWKVHREVDSHHLRLGLDLCDDVPASSARGALYQRTLAHGARLYEAMLTSWVRESTASHPALRRDLGSRVAVGTVALGAGE